jgi:AraC-like DNA-binding protein
MVSNRCKLAVKAELRKLDLHFIIVELGEVEIMEDLSVEQLEALQIGLNTSGLELIDDKNAILIEKIKSVIIEMVHHNSDEININFSVYLSERLHYEYKYLSKLFSEVQGCTIEHYIIAHKIERAKELIIYDELNLTQISYILNYSSIAHLSHQFKKVTGLSPSQFKNLKIKTRISIEDI